MKEKKLKSYHIETLDGTGSFHFFTSAINHKKAVNNLLKNSLDFKNIVHDNKDLTITVKYVP